MRKIFVLSIFALILLSTLALADADINDDGIIDVLDLILVTQNFGKTSGFTDPEVDTDNNGIIDIFDVVYVASRIGTTITCTDGTLYSQCSVTKPMYCNNGTLILRCSTCGCPTGQTCQANESCTTPPSCTGTCKTNTCNSYTSCSSASGTCTTGYCCTGSCTTPGGNEVYAASLSPADIQSAVNSASPGDTVVLPAGDYSGFNTAVTVPNGISIRGAGKTATILRSTANAGYTYMFKFNEGRVASSYKVEISGFSLYGNNVDGQNPTDIGIQVNQMEDFQVHDIAFKYFGYAGFLCHGWSRGVVYECDFIDNWYPGLGYGVYAQGDVTGDPFNGYGDYVWTQYPANTNPGWGTNQFIFVEDCYFSGNRHNLDSIWGGRYVCRYNNMTGQHLGQYAAFINVHGRTPFNTGTHSGGRGSRAIEVYHNTLYISDDADAITLQNGDGLIWNNTLTGDISDGHGVMVQVYDYTGDAGVYPVSDQERQSYIWGNTQNGVDCDWNEFPTAIPGVLNSAPAWLVKERDFHLHELSGYTPYPYPHPLRNT